MIFFVKLLFRVRAQFEVQMLVLEDLWHPCSVSDLNIFCISYSSVLSIQCNKEKDLTERKRLLLEEHGSGAMH